MLADTLPGGPAHPHCESWVAKEPRHGTGQSTRVLRLHKDPRDAVGHHLGKPPHSRCNHGPGMGTGLDGGDAEPLAPGRHEKEA